MIVECKTCKYFQATGTKAGPEWSPNAGVTTYGHCKYPLPLAVYRLPVEADMEDCPTWKSKR